MLDHRNIDVYHTQKICLPALDQADQLNPGVRLFGCSAVAGNNQRPCPDRLALFSRSRS